MRSAWALENFWAATTAQADYRAAQTSDERCDGRMICLQVSPVGTMSPKMWELCEEVSPIYQLWLSNIDDKINLGFFLLSTPACLIALVQPGFFAEMQTHLEVMGKKGVSASDADKPLCITVPPKWHLFLASLDEWTSPPVLNFGHRMEVSCFCTDALIFPSYFMYPCIFLAGDLLAKAFWSNGSLQDSIFLLRRAWGAIHKAISLECVRFLQSHTDTGRLSRHW